MFAATASVHAKVVYVKRFRRAGIRGRRVILDNAKRVSLDFSVVLGYENRRVVVTDLFFEFGAGVFRRSVNKNVGAKLRVNLNTCPRRFVIASISLFFALLIVIKICYLVDFFRAEPELLRYSVEKTKYRMFVFQLLCFKTDTRTNKTQLPERGPPFVFP